MTGIKERSAATFGAPSFGCRIAQMSAKQEMTRMVSDTLSPLEADDDTEEIFGDDDDE